jgi:hypothetical protein
MNNLHELPSAWTVTKHYELTNGTDQRSLIIILEAEGLNPAKVIFNGQTRRYEWDGWEVLLDSKYHASIDEALSLWTANQGN